jgi:ubiquinone/menaquinone biosynthesis C-methylase UbiE
MTTDLWGYKTQGINYDRYRPQYPTDLINKVASESGKKPAYLDVATGTGQLLFHLYSKFEMSFGVDMSEQMVQVSSAKAREINLQ